uniref:Uncharacterized protein n=1 Tax=Panagrolaimus davidi TaxID=227884 RepID=A0A914QCG5_9BILA
MTEYTFKKPRPQYFSLPSDVIYRLWKSPVSSNGLQKLYQTCKYFFLKRKVLIVSSAQLDDKEVFSYLLDLSRKSQDLRINVKLPQKFLYWFDRDLYFYVKWNHVHNPNFKLLKNIYRCTVKEFFMTSGIISINEFKMLTMENTIQDFAKGSSALILDSDGKHCTIDVILQNLPNIIKFTYDDRFGYICGEILEKINQCLFWNNFLEFKLYLHRFDCTFDPTLLCNIIKKNVTKGCEIHFNESIPSAQYAFTSFRHVVNEMFKFGYKPVILLRLIFDYNHF